MAKYLDTEDLNARQEQVDFKRALDRRLQEMIGLAAAADVEARPQRNVGKQFRVRKEEGALQAIKNVERSITHLVRYETQASKEWLKQTITEDLERQYNHASKVINRQREYDGLHNLQSMTVFERGMWEATTEFTLDLMEFIESL